MATESVAPAGVAASASATPAAPLGIYLEMTLLGAMFGVATVVGKYAAEGFPVFTVSAVRVLIATAAFIPIIAIFERRWPRLTRRDVAWFLLLGATGFLGFSALYYLGLQHTTASHAVIVFAAGPILTALISAGLLHEPLTGEKLSGILLTMVGITLIVLSTGSDLGSGSALGDLAVLAAILCWSCYGILSRPLITRFGPLVVTAYSVMSGALLITPLAFAAGMRPETLGHASATAWISVIYSGLFSTVFAYTLWNRGVRAIGPTLTILFMNLSPISGFVASFILRGESITWWHLLATVLVMVGVWIANRTGLRQSLRRARAA